jgi:hypothetical protein
MAQATRECRGMPKLGIAPHTASRQDFGNSKSSKDGLMPFCKACDKAYQTAWRASKQLGGTAALVPPTLGSVAATVEAAEERIVDGTAAQAAEHAELDAAIEAAGGNGSEAGQALLAQAADASAQARRDARNARRRERRAADKLPTTTAEFTADVSDILNG